MTTEINIDYYNELKAKADKWDEKETPLKPTEYTVDIFDFFFKCKCGYVIDDTMDYCKKCGQKLSWEGLR